MLSTGKWNEEMFGMARMPINLHQICHKFTPNKAHKKKVHTKAKNNRNENIGGFHVTSSPPYWTKTKDLGRFPFTKKFRKFRLGCKWNTRFWFVPLENFWNKRNF